MDPHQKELEELFAKFDPSFISSPEHYAQWLIELKNQGILSIIRDNKNLGPFFGNFFRWVMLQMYLERLDLKNVYLVGNFQEIFLTEDFDRHAYEKCEGYTRSIDDFMQISEEVFARFVKLLNDAEKYIETHQLLPTEERKDFCYHLQHNAHHYALHIYKNAHFTRRGYLEKQ